jgi:choline monooxygenase
MGEDPTGNPPAAPVLHLVERHPWRRERTIGTLRAMRRPLPPEAYLEESTYAATRLPVDFASTLIPDAYVEPAFDALERERVFAKSWVPVCVPDEVREPGDFIVVDVAGRSIIVTRNLDGELRAHHNVCRHRGARLCEGSGHVKRFFSCPYHAWAYDLDGACLGTPLFTPESEVPVDQRAAFDMSDIKAFDKADMGLHPVRVGEWGCLVFVCLDPDTPSLEEELGDLTERLAGYRLDEYRLAARVEYDIQANWKLIGENFMEYYHLPWVHPGLVKVSPMDAHYRWQGPGMYVGFCTWPIAANSDDGGWKGLPPLTGLEGQDAESARFAWLFPNVAINAMPNHVFLLLARPDGPDRTAEVAYLLTHPESIAASDDPEGETAALLEFWDEVNKEDIGIVERVQDGLRNPAYEGGRMCYRFEESCHRFQNMLIDRILGIWGPPPGDDDETVRMFGPRETTERT